MGLKFKIIISLSLIFLISFSIFIFIMIYDQYSKKNKELEAKIENNSKLIAMTNVTNLWNFDIPAMELNISSFLKDKDIILIEIKDINEKSVVKLENDKKGKLVSKKEDLIYQDKKIGSAETVFTHYNLDREITGTTIKLIIMGIILLGIISFFLYIITNHLTAPILNLTNIASRIAGGEMNLKASEINTRSKEVESLAKAFNSMTLQLKNTVEGFKKNNEILIEIINKAKEIIVNLNSSSKEIEAAAQEQTSGANEHASGITEVTATLEELSITAKQITKNVGELVLSSEEVIKTLHENENQLLDTVSQLEDIGNISRNNAKEIGELGKRSVLINEMVELIKEVANKTNILSINASIEASRSGDAGTGFSVVAAEIRELSKETITSAKEVEKAAKEIQDFLNSIIISSESESDKVIKSGKTVKVIYENIESIVSKINNNYTFTQKIDVSIKQQESGSKQAAETMKQMAEIARQSAETSRQILLTVKDIVNLSVGLDDVVKKFKEG